MTQSQLDTIEDLLDGIDSIPEWEVLETLEDQCIPLETFKEAYRTAFD